ncbi:MAG: cysteine desulfurase family protein [Pseudomonadota bacterium]
MSDRLYLDHNATSPLRPEVRDVMVEALAAPRNASSVHAEGRAAKALVEGARKTIAARINAPVESVVFTAGGTEADTLALTGLVRGGPNVRCLMVSAIEHSAVTATAEALHRDVDRVETVPVTEAGVLDLAALEERLASYDQAEDGPFLLSVMLANNETGVIQPIADIAPMVWKAGGYLFVDAVQGFGKIDIDFSALGADAMALSAHKAGGPPGVGALVVKPGLSFAPLLRGGGQELSRRAGTENVAGIAGFGALAEVAEPSAYEELSGLRDAIEAALPDSVRIWGKDAKRLPNTSCFSARGFQSETQVMVMDLAGFAVSSGSACSSGKVKPSPVLKAMGASEIETKSSLRVSLGWDSPSDTAERFIAAWSRDYQRVLERSAA